MRHRRLPRWDFAGHQYFMTCCTEGRQRFLRHADLAELLLSLYVATRHRQEIWLHGYVIMPDHYHLLLTLQEGTSLSAVVRKTHSLFRAGGKLLPNGGFLRSPGRVWQRRFYDHVIRNQKDWEQREAYVHYNPVAAGLIDDPVKYPWSSCAYWETGVGPVRCDPPWCV